MIVLIVSELIEFDVLDFCFEDCFCKSVRLECLVGGCCWIEGFVYLFVQCWLLWSDIFNECMLSWCEVLGYVVEFCKFLGYMNGYMLDCQGWFVSCEYGGWCVVWIEYDGFFMVLVFYYKGKCLNSFNDVVVKLDGSVWFIDLFYGILDDYEGVCVLQEQIGCYVYWLNLVIGELCVVIDLMIYFNGFVFFFDECWFYVVDMGLDVGMMCCFVVDVDGVLSGGEVFICCDIGFYDGFCCDIEGCVWISVGCVIYCYLFDGMLIGCICMFEWVFNFMFGGFKCNCFFICVISLVYVLLLFVNGVKMV